MTAEEYKAYCLRCLDTRGWQKEQSDLAGSYREYYASGGWSEEDLATLVTLHMLFEVINTAYTGDVAERMFDFWLDLPIRKDLKMEVYRKAQVEAQLKRLECIDPANLSEDLLPIHREHLERARENAVAASLGVIPWMPEWMKGSQAN